MDSKRLHRWYKEVLSGFRQKKECGELRKNDIKMGPYISDIKVPILKIENYGRRIGIDDKYINGEYCTILYNLETSNIIIAVRSTKSEEVYKALRTYFTVEQRFEVEVVTKDCANNYDWLARKAFPNAIRVADKFHIMMLIYSALQQIRMEYKNEYIIEQENQQQKEWSRYHIDLKKAKQGGRSILKSNYIVNEVTYTNGDTTKQLLTRSKYLLYIPEEEWKDEQKNRAAILFEKYPDIKNLYKSI
jgi:transposase